jgi:Tol biopolymer transport system component
VALAHGTRLGAYEILSLIGSGGMGEVYRARDSRLNRDVAIKVLPADVAADHDRLARFEREAQVLASLNHSNIAQIHGVDDSSGTPALVMELVEGPTLADRIAKGPIRLDEALPIAKQIAEALEAAHEQGIIHRDLKPANIKVRADGTVKVLDFGLAKAFEPTAPGVGNATMSPTLSMHATQAGIILGTAAYMSPEQARGKPVDRRTDIWAFGCVFFEMLTGRQAFNGETVTDVIAAVVNGQPDWSALPPTTPIRIRTLLAHCVKKDPSKRLPHICVARLEIEDAVADPHAIASTNAPGGATRARTAVPWAIAVVGLATAGTLGAMMLGHREVPTFGAVRFELATAGDVTLGHNVTGRGTGPPAPHFAPSPNGRLITYVAYRAGQKPQLWVRRLDELSARVLPGTEDAAFPFWSPDSRFIGFFAQGKLKKIDVSGGPPLTVCDAAAGEGGTWNRDNIIVFARDSASGLFRVSAGGGGPTPVTTLDAASGEVSHSWAQFLPDGRHFLYLAMRGAIGGSAAVPDFRAIFVGSLDSADRTLVLPGVLRAAYGGGHLLFLREATLMAQPFDARTMRLAGDPVPIADGIANNIGNGRTALNLSDNGVLAYRRGITAGSGREVLVWRDRSGRRLGVVGAAADYVEAQLSPDARMVAVLIGNRAVADPTAAGPQRGDLWLLDLGRNAIPTRLTSREDQPKMGLEWSVDGRRVAFMGVDGPQRGGVYAQSVPSVGDAELLFAFEGMARTEGGYRPTSWSPDGRFMALTHVDLGKAHGDMELLPRFGDRKPTVLLQSTFNYDNAAFSPDGRWIAYTSDKDGASEVYVRAFPKGDREWRLSEREGNAPKWRGDGRELFYWNSPSHSMMAAPIRSDGSFEPGTPVQLFELGFMPHGGVGQYSVTADGQRFLIIETENVASQQGQASEAAIEVVLDWTALLNK